MSKSRKALVLGVTAALALTVAACGSDNKSGEGAGSLTIALTSSPSATALEALAKDFEKETGIKVSVVQLTYDQISTKILLAAGQPDAAYDVVQFDSPMYPALVSGEALADLSGHVKGSDKYDYADFPDQVQQYAMFGEDIKSIPLSTEPYVLWSNSDLLAASGLEPADTLDEYVANAKAFTEAGAYGSDNAFGAQESAYYWLQAVYMFGGQITKPGTCESALDSPEVEAATKFYFDMQATTPAMTLNGGGNEMTSAFIQGDVGQMVNATGYWSIVADPDQSNIPESFVMTLPPAGDNGRHTLVFGWLIGITANSAAQDQAWQFLEFALGKDSMDKLIELGAPPPARTSLVTSPNAQEAIPYVDLLVEASSYGAHLPYTPVMNEIITEVSAAISAAATDGSGADGFLPKAREMVASILSDADVCL
ncbi:MAG: extracellular solute-binding protein [Micrococcales bacterium]|nr:extracellular solute-binding protein [Micrococcales bacterium]